MSSPDAYDQRPAPAGWTRAYWPDEVIAMFREQMVEVISLDHDLGDDQRGTGYDVITWIEQEVALGRLTPTLILVHSANPIAAQRMRAGIESISNLVAGMPLFIQVAGMKRMRWLGCMFEDAGDSLLQSESYGRVWK